MKINTDNFKSVTLVDQVEERILHYIEKNKLMPGDPIANEADLAASLNVGRNVVREALSRLRMLGMIESRTRRGMVLREPALLDSLAKVINPYILGEDTILDLLGFRIALEIGITDQVFSNLTDEDITELEEIVSSQKHLGKNKFSIESELAFHKKLYEISQNSIILSFQTIILPIFTFLHEHFDEFIPFNEKYEKHRKLVTHSDLLEFIKQRDSEGYRAAIIKHFEAYVEFINLKKNPKS